MAKRLVVVGGGAAGMSAASAARRTDPELEITVLESGPFPSYGVCGIPYYLSGVVPDAQSLVSYPAEEFRERRRIDLRLESPVASIDVTSRTVATEAGELLVFDALVLSLGARPIVPRIPGVDDPRVVTIRRLDEAIALRSRLAGVRRAVVVGAGYVGLEMAESLCESGIRVTVVDRLPRVMSTLDSEVAEIVEQEVRRHAELILSSSLVAIHAGADELTVELVDRSIDTDLVVLALGVQPQTELVDGQVEMTSAGALLVNSTMRTSAPAVFAAGDCVALQHRVLRAPAYVPLGPAANKTGRVAGTVAAGGSASFGGIVGTAVAKVFDLTVAHTGLTLAAASAAGISAMATDVTAKSRAKYYPGAEPLRVRLVHTTVGRVLGAQLVGRDGAAQRINVIAAALQGGMTIDDVASMDLAYAPPYSPVYDPITQAAAAAQLAIARAGAR
ncbi:MAG: FAD-dependent oxidoreductase [Candidatus Nanopelagicales bacterium]|nr:FAD-dependent oxidoreductase [Candidatus Nanopelagicales bacterium]